MWKKTLLTLLIASPMIAATQLQTNQIQHQAAEPLPQQMRFKQRQNFLALERLLQNAEKQKLFSLDVLALAEKLFDRNYPLQEDAAWLLLKYKLNLPENQDVAKKQALLADFSQRYPLAEKRYKLSQLLFKDFYQQQEWTALFDYAKQHSSLSADNQCRLFSAKYQVLADKLQINPEAEQAGNKPVADTDELDSLLAEFEQFWLNTDTLPTECNDIDSYWRDQGLKTDEKVKQKAAALFAKGAKKALYELSLNSHDELQQWLNSVQELLNNPQHLQNFAENRPVDPHAKSIVLAAFPNFVKTLSEQSENPDFARYQTWAERWNLSPEALREWKMSFVNRLFDNNDPIFQLWRDEQVKELKADNLTERRLRLAILHKAELNEWLELLSAEAKNKVEWRYWAAKNDPKRLAEIAKERGFYPMLAANALNLPYQLQFPDIKPLNETQKHALQPALERITELRQLERFSTAKSAWVELLQSVDFDEKLALSHYATEQDWYDLAVEGTIQAKAWDYVPLRLPNAYSDWFDFTLANKLVSKSFAMAIARQESAWNVQARSHANAMGLMQMLPTTAAATAKQSQLPYQAERDLFDPFHNIMLGTAHLAELNEKYPNNRILIAAAYNAGSSRVERWLARAGGKLAMDEFIATIPFFETRGYVQNVLAYDFYYQTLYGKSQTLFTSAEQRAY